MSKNLPTNWPSCNFPQMRCKTKLTAYHIKRAEAWTDMNCVVQFNDWPTYSTSCMIFPWRRHSLPPFHVSLYPKRYQYSNRCTRLNPRHTGHGYTRTNSKDQQMRSTRTDSCRRFSTPPDLFLKWGSPASFRYEGCEKCSNFQLYPTPLDRTRKVEASRQHAVLYSE